MKPPAPVITASSFFMIKAYFTEVRPPPAEPNPERSSSERERRLRQCTVGISMNAGMIAAVLALASVAIVGVIYARRAWLLSTALERQLTDTRSQQAEQHREDLDRAQVSTVRLE